MDQLWDSMALWLTVLGALGGVLSALGAEIRQRRRQRAHELTYETPETLEDRLQRLAEASETAKRLSREVGIEIDALTSNAARAREEAEEAQQLVTLTQAQRDAVANLVRGEMSAEFRGNSRREFWRSFAQNVLFFVLGVIASVAVTLLVRP